MGCELIRSDLSAGDALLGAVEGGGGGAGDVLRMEGFVDGLFGGRVDGAAWFFARVRGVRRVWGGFGDGLCALRWCLGGSRRADGAGCGSGHGCDVGTWEREVG